MDCAMRLTVLLAGSMGWAVAAATSLDGRYLAEQNPGTTMTLAEAADGHVVGTVADATADHDVERRSQCHGLRRHPGLRR